MEWTVGPIPINDNLGKEIILRYDTDIKSQSLYIQMQMGAKFLREKEIIVQHGTIQFLNQ